VTTIKMSLYIKSVARSYLDSSSETVADVDDRCLRCPSILILKLSRACILTQSTKVWYGLCADKQNQCMAQQTSGHPPRRCTKFRSHSQTRKPS